MGQDYQSTYVNQEQLQVLIIYHKDCMESQQKMKLYLMDPGKKMRTLLDTGSTMGTISHTYYHSNLTDIDLFYINELLDIECDDEKQLLVPYE